LKQKKSERVVVTGIDKRSHADKNGIEKIKYLFTFECPGGASKKALLTVEKIGTAGFFGRTVAGDAGELVYKAKGHIIQKVLGFRREGFAADARLSLLEKVFCTKGGITAMTLVSCFCVMILWVCLISAVQPLPDTVAGRRVGGLLFVVLFAVSLFAPAIVIALVLKWKPEKKAQARLMAVRAHAANRLYTEHVAIFELADGSRKACLFNTKAKKSYPEVNQKGILTYKALGQTVEYMGFEAGEEDV